MSYHPSSAEHPSANYLLQKCPSNTLPGCPLWAAVVLRCFGNVQSCHRVAKQTRHSHCRKSRVALHLTISLKHGLARRPQQASISFLSESRPTKLMWFVSGFTAILQVSLESGGARDERRVTLLRHQKVPASAFRSKIFLNLLSSTRQRCFSAEMLYRRPAIDWPINYKWDNWTG